MTALSRRDFIAASAALPIAAAVSPRLALAATPPTALRVENRIIEVNGRAASMLHIGSGNGVSGLYTESGRRFHVTLENRLKHDKTLIHWHGLTPDFRQDGVPKLSQPALEPGGIYAYDFPLTFPGTHWMHSHYELQEQQLLAAPLIVRDPAEAHLDEQEVVVMLHDFTFRDPDEILNELRQGGAADEMPPGEARMSGKSMSGMEMSGMAMDINDIEFDAYLANDRTLADPQVVRVEPGGRLRLRIINAGASTNFQIDLGGLEGELIAVDGWPVAPLRGTRFPIAMAQRLDIRLTLPAGQGVYPVLAIREGDVRRTGILLATASAGIKRLSDRAEHKAAILGFDLERRLAAADPLPVRPADRVHNVDLTGEMSGYVWGLNGVTAQNHTPLEIAAGERVEIVFRNNTMMSHPMHLHGHAFQVVEIDGRRFSGARRDTVHVPAFGAQVTVAFEADNPGNWLMHCHNLYHAKAGMLTTLRYVDQPRTAPPNS
jgi:FtsP/CotA-like multicopper oxidase with cupredoxin domain